MITLLAPAVHVAAPYFHGTFGHVLEAGAIAGAVAGLYFAVLFVKQNIFKKPGNIFQW